MPRVLPLVVSVQVFPRGQEHRLRLRRARFEPGSGRRQKERENLETGRNSTESLLQCPQLASFTALSSGIPLTKGVESDSEGVFRFTFLVS